MCAAHWGLTITSLSPPTAGKAEDAPQCKHISTWFHEASNCLKQKLLKIVGKICHCLHKDLASPGACLSRGSDPQECVWVMHYCIIALLHPLTLLPLLPSSVSSHTQPPTPTAHLVSSKISVPFQIFVIQIFPR